MQLMKAVIIPSRRAWPHYLGALALTAAMGWGLAGCAGDAPRQPQRTPESIQADIQALIPPRVTQRAAWAVDLLLVFAA